MSAIAEEVAPQIAAPTRTAGASVIERITLLTRDDAWVRPAIVAIGLLAAALYTWNLTVSGYANDYYSAAALAGSKDWAAWFFGSFDAGNFITVDKPPASLWVLGLSVRLIGLSSWSILLPQALMGVATVLVLFAAVRRSFGPVAAVIAVAVMASTPVAVLMFRYDNPDALLTLLLVSAAWALLKALDDRRLRWIVLTAVLVGLAFDTKFLQAALVIPAFGLAYLLAATGSVRRRLATAVVGAVSLTVAAGWWVLAIELWPKDARPYIGGSTTNSALELLLGYDGLGRLFGGGGPPGAQVPTGTGDPVGGPTTFMGGGFGGVPDLLRMFNDAFGGQISWLIPLALIGLAVGLLARGRASRRDPARAGYLLWGGWLLVHVAVFSFMSGIVHPYYAVAMAPAVAALAGAGLVQLWRLRSTRWVGGLLLAVSVLITAWWATQVLARSPGFLPGLSLVVLGLAGVAAVALAVPWLRTRRFVSGAAIAMAMAAILLAPVSYSLETTATAYSGGDPQAGPMVTAGSDGGMAGPGGIKGVGGGPRGGPIFIGGPGAAPGNLPANGPAAGPGGVGGFTKSGPGGELDQALIDYLVGNRGDATWLVATNGTGEAAGIQLATGEPVMAMGGFSGGDPAPTLEQLKAYIQAGHLRYVMPRSDEALSAGPAVDSATMQLAPGSGPVAGKGGPGDSARDAWVTASCTPVDYKGDGSASTSGLYDCAGAA